MGYGYGAVAGYIAMVCLGGVALYYVALFICWCVRKVRKK